MTKKKKEANKVYAITTNYTCGDDCEYDSNDITTNAYDSFAAAKELLADMVADAHKKWVKAFGEDMVEVKWGKNRRSAVVFAGSDTYECKIVEFDLVSSK